VTILVVGIIDDPMLSRGSRVTLKTFFSFSKSGWGIPVGAGFSSPAPYLFILMAAYTKISPAAMRGGSVIFWHEA
jgi:hypothetical protein